MLFARKDKKNQKLAAMSMKIFDVILLSQVWGHRGSHELGNGRDLIQVLLKRWRLTLKLESDHTCLCAV